LCVICGGKMFPDSFEAAKSWGFYESEKEERFQ
jgi:hypothetical protein